MASLTLYDGIKVVPAEVVDAHKSGRGLRLRLRVGGSAVCSTFQTGPSEKNSLMRRYDVSNPNYLIGKSVEVYYSGVKLVRVSP